MTLNNIQKKLRTYNRKNYYLFFFCNAISLMLITAYAAMMFAPTVLTVLPEGGDSRKQMMAIFVLACVGCIVFTVYGASLFFRMKAKEIGIFMALGASRKRLKPMLIKETILVSTVSSGLGTILGIPFAAAVWQLFRLFIVDTEEMKLTFDYRCILVSVLFVLFAITASVIIGLRYLKKTNLMEVIHEEHKNEPVPPVKRWYGPAGIAILLIGAVGGYSLPTVYMNTFSVYPPAWLNLFYAPVFAGLYLLLLHTIIYGWLKRRNKYSGLISRSMMKFQGKQTVNNMLVVTVLIAGACFGIFYLPMLGTAQILEIKNREYDYVYSYRLDQTLPQQADVEKIAGEHHISLTNWVEGAYLTLAMDGEAEIEEEDKSFHMEYEALLNKGDFFSESTFGKLTGNSIDVPAGNYYAVMNEEETHPIFVNRESTIFTNMATRQTLNAKFGGIIHANSFAGKTEYYVLDDQDYKNISEGLTPDWMGNVVRFNTENKDSYAFAVQLFNTIVDSFGPECEYPYYYDPVASIAANEKGETYWGDTEDMTGISFDNRDSTEFRMYWTYMPYFRMLDQNDALKTTAVFMMMFLFIAIVCITAAMIICYTRCITIAINNKYVFEDLSRLGAAPAFIKKEIRGQSLKVFSVPAVTGMSLMFLLYSMIMYANDGRITSSEIAGLLVCLAISIVLVFIIYGVYRVTIRKMWSMIKISC